MIEKIQKLSDPVFNDTYRDGLLELVLYYASLPYWLGMVQKFSSVRFIIHEVYRAMIARKDLPSIEELTREEKLRIYKLTEGLEKGERVKASRSIYLIEKILEK